MAEPQARGRMKASSPIENHVAQVIPHASNIMSPGVATLYPWSSLPLRRNGEMDCCSLRHHSAQPTDPYCHWHMPVTRGRAVMNFNCK